MKTVKVSNGLISFDSNGVMETVSGPNKAAQDVARAILTEYNQYFDTGSNLFRTDLNSAVSEVAIERAVNDCIYRLLSKQVNASQDDRIVKVNKIQTARVDATTVVFYVEVLHESGRTVEFADSLTQLDHLLDIAKVYK